MIRSAIALAILLAIGLETPVARGRDWYVDNLVGDDRYDGRSSEVGAPPRGPCHTIAKPLRLARPGDRIVLTATGEPYRESLTLAGPRHSASDWAPFEIDGQGATLSGTGEVPEYAWEHFQGAIFRFRPTRLVYHQLYLDGCPAPRRPAAGTDPELPLLEPHEWCLWRGYLYVRLADGRRPEDYPLFHSAAEVGITLVQTRGVVIHDLVVEGFRLDGIAAHDDVRYTTLASITARGNGRAGISVTGASQVVLTASLVGDNLEAQLLAGERGRLQVTNSTLLDRTAPATELLDAGRITIDGVPAEPR